MSRLRAAVAKAGSISDRNFALLACSSLIATGAVIGGSVSDGGFRNEALAAMLASGQQPTAPLAAAAAVTPDAPAVTDAPSAPVGGGPQTAAPDVVPSSSTVTDDADVPTDTEDPEEPTDTEDPEEPTDPVEDTGPFGHVFVVSLASPGYEKAFGAESEMPYLSEELRPQGALLSEYSLLSATPLPNYIAMVGGQRPNELTKQGCSGYREFPATAAPDSKGYVEGDGCVYPVLALSVADQIAATGKSWHAYIEGMADETGDPANCVHPVAGEAGGVLDAEVTPLYEASRNPFVYFHSLLDLGACTANDVPMDELGKDLKKESSTASYSFISPNPCHAGAQELCADGSAGVASSDEFLSKLVPQILRSPAYRKDGLLIVTFGEQGPTFEGDDLTVGTLAISESGTPGATIAGDFDPYSLLRTTEDLFGVSPLAAASTAESFAGSLANNGD